MIRELDSSKYWENLDSSIPGTLQLPLDLLAPFLLKTYGYPFTGLDLGSGSGKHISMLQQAFGPTVYAVDLNLRGLMSTIDTSLRVKASAQALPFVDNSFHYVVMCGLMTNLVGTSLPVSIKLRNDVVSETYRVLKPGGYVAVSDCSTTLEYAPYTNYYAHERVTGEYGVKAIFDSPPPPNSFKEDDSVERYLASGRKIVRLTKHYDRTELSNLYEKNGFMICNLEIVNGINPLGRSIDNILMVAKKM